MARRLLWNPDWNAYLFLVSLAERIIAEPSPFHQAELERRLSRIAPQGCCFSYRISLAEGRTHTVAYQGHVG